MTLRRFVSRRFPLLGAAIVPALALRSAFPISKLSVDFVPRRRFLRFSPPAAVNALGFCTRSAIADWTFPVGVLRGR